VVRPPLAVNTLGGDFTDAELAAAANMVAGAASERLGSASIIDEAQLPAYSHCRCRTVVLHVVSYRAIVSTLGRKRGRVVLDVKVHLSPTAAFAERVTIDATGEKEWGSTAPMHSAFSEAASAIEVDRVLNW
jgi:hypothetical protein